MNLVCNPALAEDKKSASQIARVITEGWFAEEAYCLNCTSLRLDPTVAGTAVRDFVCPKCDQFYELKSAARAHTRIVQDGGYESMMRRMRSGEAPALMLMHYENWCVRGLVAIHPVFLTPAVVMKRKNPHIRPKTKTPYWMCDLSLSLIPPDGKIVLVRDGQVQPTAKVRRAFHESLRLADIPLKERGWTAQVLNVMRKIGKKEFTLAEVYAYEKELHAIYPGNNHVKEKMRQQLQILRNHGYLEFLSRGEYRALH